MFKLEGKWLILNNMQQIEMFLKLSCNTNSTLIQYLLTNIGVNPVKI